MIAQVFPADQLAAAGNADKDPVGSESPKGRVPSGTVAVGATSSITSQPQTTSNSAASWSLCSFFAPSF